MHAILIVGGRGTRLQPLTDTRPKAMMPIVDRPFLEWQLAHLKAHGVTGVTFACGFLPDAIQEYFGDGTRIGMDLTYVIEDEPLGTAGAIAFAARTLEPQRLIVCNGDLLTDLDITELVRRHEAAGAVATIALTPVEDPTRYGLVRTKPDGEVTEFVEKPPIEECDTNLINGGTYVLEPGVIDAIPAQGACSIERETFPALAGKGLYAFGFDGYWNDIGTIQSYVQANIDVLDGSFGGTAHPGGVWIAPDAIVHPDATVGNGSVVSHGAVLGAGAEVGQVIILEGATIGAGAKVHGVVVGEQAVIDDGAVVEPGVVAPGATVAATV